ncbi:MAG: glycosyltransferase family 4 protein [Candidatus Omnitrophota bacterium]
MAEYLKDNAADFSVVSVVSHFSEGIAPSCKYYVEGKLRKDFKLLSFRFPASFGILNQMMDAISICHAFLRLRRKFEIYIGTGQLYTFVGLFLKKMGFFKKVVYYSGDYFESVKLLKALDAIDVRFADAVWNSSQAMIEARKKNNLQGKKNAPSLVFRLGVRMPQAGFYENKYDSNDIAFIGNLQKRHGLDLFLDIFPELIKEFPDLRLNIIGKGSYEKDLKIRIRQLGVDNNVVFHGFVAEEEDLDKIFSKCSLGLALYEKEEGCPTKYADPGKIKDYLAHGLPVIMTDISEIAREVHSYGSGLVIGYSRQELKAALLSFLRNRQLICEFGRNAARLAAEYTWDKILDGVFSQTLAIWAN